MLLACQIERVETRSLTLLPLRLTRGKFLTDDKRKKAVSEPVVTVDATKVAEEKEEEADVEGEETMGTKRSRRGEEKGEGEVSSWADVGVEETL